MSRSAGKQICFCLRGMKRESNWNLIISVKETTWWTSARHQTKSREEDGGSGGGGLFLTTTWRPKRKRRMQSATRGMKLRKRGCARQTLPTVELKCYCKVTRKVPVRQTLTPSYRLTSSQSVPSFSQAKGVTQQLEQRSLKSVQY